MRQIFTSPLYYFFSPTWTFTQHCLRNRKLEKQRIEACVPLAKLIYLQAAHSSRQTLIWKISSNANQFDAKIFVEMLYSSEKICLSWEAVYNNSECLWKKNYFVLSTWSKTITKHCNRCINHINYLHFVLNSGNLRSGQLKWISLSIA